MGGPIQIETLNLDLFPSPEINLAGLSFETHDSKSILPFKANQMEVGHWVAIACGKENYLSVEPYYDRPTKFDHW